MCVEPVPVRLVEPQDYRTRAASKFQVVRDRIRQAVPYAEVEHIGSSAVPDLLSKGDLDVLVVVPEVRFADATDALLALGYSIKQGSLRTNELCPFIAEPTDIETGIQLIVKGSQFEFFRTFRDLLANSEGLRSAYNDLKRRSAPLGQDEYRRAKSEFIERLLSEP